MESQLFMISLKVPLYVISELSELDRLYISPNNDDVT